MKLDILLITYNQAQYIAQALDGLMMQRVNLDVEVRVIVADDASTDDTLAIIRSYEAQSPFPFIYLPTEGNMGHINNYKRAFAACTSDYVCVLEGDDWWCNPYHIQYHIDFLDQHKECVVSVNRLVEYYPEISLYSIPADKYGYLCFYNIKDQILKNHINNHSSACYRNSTLQLVPQIIFSEGFDDWILGLFLAHYGLIAQLPEVTSVYRVHQQGVYSGSNMAKKQEYKRRSIDLAYQLVNEEYFDLIKSLDRRDEFGIIRRKKVLDYIPTFMVKLYRFLMPPVLH